MPAEEAKFWLPALEEAADIVRMGLASNYREVEVSVGPCPDLQALGCAFSGLNGHPFLIEIGGEPYVHNPNHRAEGDFDLREIMQICGRPSGKILGAGFPSLSVTGGKCGELMPCLDMADRNLSRLARVGAERECIVEDYRSLRHGGLGNLYVSDGLPGDVIHVEARCRFGSEASLTQSIRTALSAWVAESDGRDVAMGGVFSVLDGRVRAHVSPDFECIPFPYYDEEREEVVRPDFLQFYDGMGPDLMCMAVLWTGDPTGGALHLRPTGEHTHFFSPCGRAEAGHYHYDVDPEAIHYRGYFQLAERVVRIADIYADIERRRGSPS